jgi:hypothetical protein
VVVTAVLAVTLAVPSGAGTCMHSPSGSVVQGHGTGARTCRYEYTIWNVHERRVVERRAVEKDRGDLSAEERGPFGCTPCREDQSEVTLGNGVRFLACTALAPRLREALDRALEQGQEIRTIVGYRPQMSRGPADASGNRTQLSNHSFGVAVDVNEMQNGLYDRCLVWSPGCRLLKGGPYRPGETGSIRAESPVVIEMEGIGLKWGGRIAGRQKDFMHFSPTGY